MGKLRKVLNVMRDGWLITGTTLLLFCGIEGISYSLLLIRDARVASSQPVDFRVEADAYADSPWVHKYWEEWKASKVVRWVPYVYWKRTPFQGRYINTDSDGIRRTWTSSGARRGIDARERIFMFGGSTVWGINFLRFCIDG